VLYAERNDERRREFEVALALIPKENRVYVDETGFNAPLIREYGYGFRGERVPGERTGKRFARTSLIAGLKDGKPIAPMEFKGYCDTQVVLAWVKDMLIPGLPPGDVVIWDNASFHKSPKLREVLAQAGIGLLFLSPYSPDLNPIEAFWATLKAWIRGLNEPLLHISQALTKVFGSILT
jgi:transposase